MTLRLKLVFVLLTYLFDVLLTIDCLCAGRTAEQILGLRNRLGVSAAADARKIRRVLTWRWEIS